MNGYFSIDVEGLSDEWSKEIRDYWIGLRD